MNEFQYNGIKVGYKIGCCLIEMQFIPENSIDLILTDPPYNKGKDYEGDISDNKPQKEFDNFNKEWLKHCLRILKPGHHLYFSCASDQFQYFIDLAIKIGFKYRHLIIWATNECKGHMNSRTWLRSYEPILWLQKPGSTYGLFNNYPNSSLDVIIQYSPHKKTIGEDKKFHICQKPIKLYETIITKSSKSGDIVFDPFLGSGTTLIASMKTKRCAIGFEVSKEYEPIIKKRILEIANQQNLLRFCGGKTK